MPRRVSGAGAPPPGRLLSAGFHELPRTIGAGPPDRTKLLPGELI